MENHHAAGGLRERVTMGSHLNDRQVFFPSLLVRFCVTLTLQLISLENFYIVGLTEFCWNRMK